MEPLWWLKDGRCCRLAQSAYPQTESCPWRPGLGSGEVAGEWQGENPGARPSHLPGTGLSLKEAEIPGHCKRPAHFPAAACLPARPALGESIASLRERSRPAGKGCPPRPCMVRPWPGPPRPSAWGHRLGSEVYFAFPSHTMPAIRARLRKAGEATRVERRSSPALPLAVSRASAGLCEDAGVGAARG